MRHHFKTIKIYDSNADWVAPSARISPTGSCGPGTPACKVNINDSDHSYYGLWNDSAQTNRNYIWQNFTNGNQVIFMDPYEIYWSNSSRNLCPNPVNGVCSGVDPRWNNLRDNLGYTLTCANKMDLAKMTPQGGLSSTGYALANAVAADAEYLVYAPSGGVFTVDLSATTRALTAEWFNPSTGVKTSAGTVAGGSSSQPFTPPFGGDAVLYLVDAGTEPSDTTPPSVPANVTATAVSSSQINLSWTASTDPDSPVAGYAVYRNGFQLANVDQRHYVFRYPRKLQYTIFLHCSCS